MQGRARYTCVELWNDLENDYQQFVTNDQTVVSSQSDAAAFEHARSTIEEVYQTGRKAEAISFFFHPYEKARLGLRLKHIFPERFGECRTAKIEGEKSLAFIVKVILPFEENTQRVEHEWWLVLLCGLVGMDIAAETAVAREVADRYRQAINDYTEKRIGHG